MHAFLSGGELMCITMTYLTNKLKNGDNSYQCWGIYTETQLNVLDNIWGRLI